MIGLQPSIAASLVGAAAVSSVVLYQSLNKEGAIRLPLSADNEDSSSLDISDGTSPFDVTKPDDYIDGRAIREDDFWAKVPSSMSNIHFTP